MKLVYAYLCGVLLLLPPLSTLAQNAPKSGNSDEDALFIRKIYDAALTESICYTWLQKLCLDIGHRHSGSIAYQEAVIYSKKTMEEMGLTVRLQACKVPHWVRGEREIVEITQSQKRLNALALGGSGATLPEGVTAQVVEVKSLDEVDKLGESLRGKIVFFNRPMDKTKINTGAAYGGAGDQRNMGPARAAKYGAVGVLVRSLTTELDDFPHTGATRFERDADRIPALGISTNDAELLSKTLKDNALTTIRIKTSCQNLPEVEAFNVIGEIKGSEFPNEILMVCGHLDSWDVGQGAHDDGAGCAHALEVLHLFKQLNYKPKRTIRVVMFANEEFGLGGGRKYAEEAAAKGEKHVIAIESDNGGFTPRGFTFEAEQNVFIEKYKKVTQWANLLEPYGLTLSQGGSGADISPLKKQGFLLAGLRPDNQRYFDHHHTQRDLFQYVHRRELELGAAAMTALVFLLDKYGN